MALNVLILKVNGLNTHKWSNGVINRLPLKSRLSDLIKKKMKPTCYCKSHLKKNTVWKESDRKSFTMQLLVTRKLKSHTNKMQDKKLPDVKTLHNAK